MQRNKEFALSLMKYRSQKPDIAELLKLALTATDLMAVRILVNILRHALTEEQIERALTNQIARNDSLRVWLDKIEPDTAALATSFKERRC